MLTAPRTDPYVKNYLIRLLPLVDRETAHWDMDVGCEAWGGDDAQANACGATSSVFVGCVDVIDVTTSG